MRRTALLLISTLLMIAVSGKAAAQASRIYFAGYLGFNHSPSIGFNESTVPNTGDIEIQDAPTFAGALGLRLNRQWRVEGELSYRNASADKITFTGGGAADLNGNMKTWLMMLNVYYDFDLNWDSLSPYLTAGVGFASHKARLDDTSLNNVDVSDTDTTLAWALGGGLKYRLQNNLALTGGYRYLTTTDPDFGTYSTEYAGHEFRLGVEWDIPVRRMK